MAKCPVCTQEVKTPFVLNVDAWRWLKCEHCGARVERKNPRFLMPLISLFLVLLALGRLGPRWATLAEVLTSITAVLIIVMLLRPELQARKPLPEPEIRLKIGGEGQSKQQRP